MPRPRLAPPPPGHLERPAVDVAVVRALVTGFLAGASHVLPGRQRFTAKQLAAITGIPERRISDLRTGRIMLPRDDLLELMKLMDLKAGDVLRDKPAEAVGQVA